MITPVLGLSKLCVTSPLIIIASAPGVPIVSGEASVVMITPVGGLLSSVRFGGGEGDGLAEAEAEAEGDTEALTLEDGE